jgi:integrase
VSVYTHLESRSWWYSFRLAGRRHRGSTGEVDRRRAQSFERKLRTRLEEELPRTGGARLTLRELGKLDESRARASGATALGVASIAAHWANLTTVLGADTGAEQVTYDLVEQYVATRRAETCRGEHTRGQTIAREVQALKRGLGRAVERRALARLPERWPKVRRDPPRESQRGHLHDLGVLRKYIAALPPEPRAQVLVGLLTGLRATELRRLTWAWVEAAPPGVNAPALLRVPAACAKTKEERLVALPRQALDALREIHDRVDRDDTPPLPLLASDWRKAYGKARKAIGYTRPISLRDLRHCHLTYGLQTTGDAAATQAAGGHKQLAVTQRYQTATIARTASVGMAVASVLDGSGHSERPQVRTRRAKAGVGMAPAGGLEPPTPGLTVRCSNQLS